MKHPFLLVFFLFLLVLTPVILSQVVQTQVIELTERTRDFFIEATKGNLVGQETGNKFGQNLAVGTSEEDIQSQGGTLIFLQAPELITISSDNVGDTLAGANATSVLIEGLDGSFLEISEIVNLSGTTNVNTTNQYIRINRFSVNEVGVYKNSNAGTITGTSALSSTIQTEIPAEEGQSKTTHFTVPAGQNLIITAFRVTMDTGKEIDIIFKFRENADDIIPPVSPVKTIRDLKGLSNPISGIIKGNLKFDEKTDIWAIGVTSVGTSQIEVNFDFVQYAIGT
ncbi:hypothetical protein LCGC14_0476630 [marine sediment metagenome]|uniref:Uncharacterized protein n=1 Tax=marine sediment metagenome TaxID=412755 RepID=A0A0F9SAN5_9ZZZZ|nr:hypothetical protein [bacterium]